MFQYIFIKLFFLEKDILLKHNFISESKRLTEFMGSKGKYPNEIDGHKANRGLYFHGNLLYLE